jgi:hypothetical protein
MELRELHYVRDQFSYRRVLHFSCHSRNQQNEAADSRAAGHKRLSGLPNVDPEQGDALSTLHNGAFWHRGLCNVKFRNYH